MKKHLNLIKILKKYKLSNQTAGFSLIEVLVAMLVLTIIVAAFTPLLTTSLTRIYEAGHRSQAIIEAQGEVESRIHRDDTTDYDLIKFEIDGEDDIDVHGGLIEVEKNIKGQSSELTSFLPFVPTITLEPSLLNEGYVGFDNDMLIKVAGHSTNFVSGTTLLSSIKGDDGFEILGNIASLESIEERESEDDPDYAYLSLNNGLTNANSPYIVEMKTGDEIVKARLQVYLPNYISVGQAAKAVVSDDPEEWFLRTSNDMPINSDLNSIIWGGSEYIAVGNTGNIVALRNRESWESINSGTSENLNCIIKGPDKYVAVGNNGTIITSSRGKSWELHSIDTSENINGICWGNNEYIIVGDKGVFYYSTDAYTWNEVDHTISGTLGNIDLYDVAYSDERFIAVGSEGFIVTLSLNGVTAFQQPSAQNNSLKSIAASGNEIVIVGSEEAILHSSDNGNTWSSSDDFKIPSGVGTLNEVINVGGLFIAVSDEGKIINSSNGIDWSEMNYNGSSFNLNSIASR